MPATRKVELGFFFLLVALATVLSFFIFKPYLGPLFMAVIFAVVFRPLYEWLHAKIRRPGFASLCTLSILFLVIVIPATLFGFFMFDDARDLYIAGSGAPVLERVDKALAPLQEYISRFIPGFEFTLSEYLNAALSFLVDNFGSVFTRVVGIVFQAVIMLFALFYLFRDGKRFHSFLVSFSPLENQYDERILNRLEGAISSVVKGKLLIVIIQGILSSIGFAIFGIPHPVLWGAVVSLAALVPAIGVAIVFIPVIMFAYLSAGLGAAIGLLVFGVVVGLIDNLLNPILLERGLQMHPLIILLSVLGGLVLFGPVGFVAGPVTLSLLLALLDIYPMLFKKEDSGA